MVGYPYKVLYALGHYSHKLKCNRAFYRLLAPFFRSGEVRYSKPLEEFWPDNGTGCICHNKLSESPAFDLQIVVPCYNVEKYVVDCIESILSQQTKFSYKVVIVNDGSTDGTRELLRRYEGIENVWIIDQPNRGLSGARNSGFAEIDAKYLLFVDSDDMLCHGAVESLMLKAYQLDADIVEGGFERFDGEKVLYAQKCSDSDDNRGISGFAWGKVYKSSLFANLRFPEGYWYEDTFCYMILHYYAKRIATVGDIIYRWRKNAVSITSCTKGNLRSIDSFWVTKCLLEDRYTLELPFNNEIRDFFLHQVRVNFTRTASIGDGEIDKAVFAETVILWKKFFGQQTVPSHDKELFHTLTATNFGLYKLECLFG